MELKSQANSAAQNARSHLLVEMDYVATCSSIQDGLVIGATCVSEDSLSSVITRDTWLNMKAEHSHVIYVRNDSRVYEVFKNTTPWNTNHNKSVRIAIVILYHYFNFFLCLTRYNEVRIMYTM